MTTEQFTKIVPPEHSGQRMDQILAALFPDFSRSRLQRWIKDGQVTVNGSPQAKARVKLVGGEEIILTAQMEAEGTWKAEPIELEVVYEDDDLLVINKPVGLVVHPAAGNPDGTLLNGLLNLEPKLIEIPRAGIVHRLDKGTSGLMVVAKTLKAQTDLVEQLQERTVKREYEAVVMGVLTGGGTVDEPIGRHPVDRKRMAVVRNGRGNGKSAITHYRVIQRYRSYTHIRVQLETGRTHQIRVHMAHLRHSLVGDSVYGGRLKLPKGASEQFIETLRDYRHQALHAVQLGLVHPVTGEDMLWQSELPEDFQQLLKALEQDAQKD
ncbi:MAG: 23S rRNA pseudouridine(1911/1915/1917) synthase RluD [Chromatiales bacterium]|nr:23S rRNA pseudouridine(1911/1915/1917) synthase RluD [Chromatiales bacterium]